MASILRSDLVLMQNDLDKLLLSEFSSLDNLICYPTPIDADTVEKTRQKLEAIDLTKRYRGDLAFQGDFKNQADIDNLDYLVKNIWPKVLGQFEDIKLDVFGSGLNRRVIEICESAPSVRPIVENKFIREPSL